MSMAWSMGSGRRDTILKTQVRVAPPQMLIFSLPNSERGLSKMHGTILEMNLAKELGE
jgi:hypothetical protein